MVMNAKARPSVYPIDQVLALMESEMWPDGFQITFVISTGQRIGQLKTVKRARKGAPSDLPLVNGRKKSVTGKPQQRRRWLHKSHETIPLVNMATEKYFTPLISHIIGFNGVPIRH